MKKKTGGRKTANGRKTTVKATKNRIQKLLTEASKLRDDGCLFKRYPETGKCGGPLAADHIRSRQYSETYADLDNVVCLCTAHHIFFKKRHPMVWAKLVEDYLGTGWIDELRSMSLKSRTWTLDMWLKKEEELKEYVEKNKTGNL